jgi:hypothetical protein
MVEILFHFYGLPGCGLAFIVKEGESTYYASPGDIESSVLLAYCEAMIDFHQNFNTENMNLYPYGELSAIIEELEYIVMAMKNGNENEQGNNKKEEDEDCILLN